MALPGIVLLMAANECNTTWYHIVLIKIEFDYNKFNWISIAYESNVVYSDCWLTCFGSCLFPIGQIENRPQGVSITTVH